MSYDIASVRTDADVQAAAGLFAGYAASLPVDLGYQDFAAELAGLPGKYAPPAGDLLLARDAARDAVGCVGLRPLPHAGTCEIKRLFVLPATRGSGLGRALAQAALTRARSLGYLEIRLDTLPSMQPAMKLYLQLGFEPCAAYYAPTPPGTLFMSRRL